MLTFRRSLSLALLFAFASLAGCSLFGGSESAANRGFRGGFTVTTDGPGQPGSAGVAADIGAFAQRRGFVRQPAGPVLRPDPASQEPLAPTPDRYISGDIVLEVTRLSAQHRVSAYVHNIGSGNDGRTISQFSRDFAREYAGRYGGADRISETAYADDSEGGTSMFGKPVEMPSGATKISGNGT